MIFRRSNAFHSVVFVILLTFLSTVCSGAEYRLGEDRRSTDRGQAEFFNANREHRLENHVNIVSGVQTPGVYHFPDSVNLVEAISLAGGAEKDADLSKVYVKRKTESGYVTYRYDLTEIVGDKNTPFPSLSDRDTILLESNHSAQNTVLVLGILSTILGIAASSFLIVQTAKK